MDDVVYPYAAYGYERMIRDAARLEAAYPELIRLSRAGVSAEGRDLLLAELGKGPGKLFVCGAMHAREYITSTYLMFMLERYARAYETDGFFGKFDIRAILGRFTFVVLPMVNPDGVRLAQKGIASVRDPVRISGMPVVEGAEYGYRAWKSNIRGVDLNRNFSVNWGGPVLSRGGASAWYGGEYPFSEPETQAVLRVIRANEFQAYISFHAQGEGLYWSKNTSRALRLAERVGRETGFELLSENEDVEDAGTEKGDGGSFLEYVEAKGRSPFLTVELCPYVGPYPYPDADFDRVWEPAGSICLAAAAALS
ncbi:MAG: hypothetical protein LBL26_05820 [Peptococcaceae bacterium]|jgi:hypothetical protein|nr:hypothetical protein [Peptococcaceae bacterium]